MLPNVKFRYLYRDAGNYKLWGEVIFANPDGLTWIDIEEHLKRAFEQEVFFVADQIDISEVFFEEITDDDHCYHEFYSVELTTEETTDTLNRTIKDFIAQVETESLRGWRAFDPMVRHVEENIDFLEDLLKSESKSGVSER